MMSTPAEATSGNGGAPATQLGKRKKSRVRGSYLGTWLERAAHHLQEEPDYEYLPHNPYPVPPPIDPCRINGYCPPEPVSLPTYPFYTPTQYPGAYWAPDCRYVQSAHKSIQVQRPRIKRKSDRANVPVTNGAFNGSYLEPKFNEEINEFTSLPPIVTSVGDTTSNSDLNNDKDSGSARRFSDPCVGRPGARQAARGEEGSGSEGEGSSCDVFGENKLLMCLVDQIGSLKVANDRLNKDLQDAKAELQSVRQQNSLWHRGSNSSLGGAQNHCLPNNNGYGQYSPGALSDLVREIREAARLREEALYARVRSMLDERALHQSGLSSALDKSTDSRNYEDIKSALRAAEADKRRMHERLARLEDELQQLRLAGGSDVGGGGGAGGGAGGEAGGGGGGGGGGEAERVRMRRELEAARRDLLDARRAKQDADEQKLKLEHLVTQMRAKFNGLHVSPGPASLASEPESPGSRAGRPRRTSTASAGDHHATLVFGPVTDL